MSIWTLIKSLITELLQRLSIR